MCLQPGDRPAPLLWPVSNFGAIAAELFFERGDKLCGQRRPGAIVVAVAYTLCPPEQLPSR